MPKQDKKELSKIFQSLDKNSEGRLTKVGMFEGYRDNFGENKLGMPEIDGIFENVNFGRSKDTEYITFSDFIMAGVDMNKVILTNHYLTLAFQVFDNEGLGVIDADGIFEGLGQNLDEEAMKQI